MKLEHTKQKLEVLDANLSGSVFENVNLSNASFVNIRMDNATISDANLTGIHIEAANLSAATFKNINLTGVKIITCGHTAGFTIDGIAFDDLWAAYQGRGR